MKLVRPGMGSIDTIRDIIFPVVLTSIIAYFLGHAYAVNWRELDSHLGVLLLYFPHQFALVVISKFYYRNNL